MSIEATFGVRFTTQQLLDMKTIGEVVDEVHSALSRPGETG
jgi:acyl carrier protein